MVTHTPGGAAGNGRAGLLEGPRAIDSGGRSSFKGTRQVRSTAPPALGPHAAEVLGDKLGYIEAQIAALRRDGVIDRLNRNA
jgi:hypothetical protein